MPLEPEPSQGKKARDLGKKVRTFLRRPAARLAIGSVAVVLAAGIVFGHYYSKYSRLIDRKLQAGPFANTSNIYAAPEILASGDRRSEAEVVADLRRSGYSERPGARNGWFQRAPDAVEIVPGPYSYYRGEPVRIQFAAGSISRITALRTGTELGKYPLDPQLIANISQSREKRRLVRFQDIPKVLVEAVLSAEDKRFFAHDGFDGLRMLKAAWVDFKEGRKEQGASTITMQLARSFWLYPAKNWKRKLEEMLITAQLEHKLTKEQIFQDYANQVYLGRRGTYSIHGFGEAARQYFGKDIRQLTLPEAATLAGLVQRPGYYDPWRYPQRARERRNIVLSLMRQNGYINGQEYAAASQAPVQLAAGQLQNGEAPYFMDLLSDDIQTRFGDRDIEAYDVYTTLDLDLQREAVEAVRAGIQKLDARLKRSRRRGEVSMQEPQSALVAIDPHTGEVRALVGGTDYGASQLNRALALRQPGSAFKPFVYAAALNTALTGGSNLFTAASVLQDEPTTFWFHNQPYEPQDFRNESYGQVTLQEALAKSVNIASVSLAQAVGYEKVAELARKAGLEQEQGTPAVALGAYDVTPLQLAGAYTVFANEGVHVPPSLISMVRSRHGAILYRTHPVQRQVLDPRVAYLMVSMMEDVLRSGTAASAWTQGFTVPAAGKTGTSRDGWFAGFTSQLLCVVWVGFDDGHDLKLEGARSALPIWTEFMKRALKYPRYASAKRFPAPAGVTSAEVDPTTGQLATPACPIARTEVFIAGTEPETYCQQHEGQPLLPSYSPAPAAAPGGAKSGAADGGPTSP